MTIKLKQSTASQEIPLGYFVDSTDGNTEETALTIANTDIKLWKMGATTLANKNSGGATHISNGIYYAVLDATDTNTLGSLVVFVHVSGALPVRVECEVLPSNIYDSWIAGTDILDVSVTQISGSAVSTSTAQLGVNVVNFGGAAGTFASGRPEVNTSHIAGSAVSTASAQIGVNVVNAGGTAWGSGAITAASLATDAITATKIAADAGTEIGTAVWASASRTLTANTNLNDLNAAGIRAAVGLAAANLDTQLAAIDDAVDTEVAAVLAAVDTEVAAIKAKTDSLTFTVAGQVDANIQSINDVTITGNGQVGTEFGV